MRQIRIIVVSDDTPAEGETVDVSLTGLGRIVWPGEELLWVLPLGPGVSKDAHEIAIPARPKIEHLFGALVSAIRDGMRQSYDEFVGEISSSDEPELSFRDFCAHANRLKEALGYRR